MAISDIFLWIKNTGTITIDDVPSTDVFIGHDGDWTRIDNSLYAGGAYPSWDYVVENSSEWTQASTLKIEISYANPFTSGEYRIKIIIPNGLSDEYEFSM